MRETFDQESREALISYRMEVEIMMILSIATRKW